MKISKKQQEVLNYLKENKTYIVWLDGLNAHCFIHSNLSYRISTATCLKLAKLNLLELKNEDEYHLKSI